MKKCFLYSLIVIGILFPKFSISQDTANYRSNHKVYFEIGGAFFIGASINYEYSIHISKMLRINPGLGIGFAYAGLDASQSFYYGAIPNLKILIGKTKHLFELGMNYNGYNFGGIAGYRKNCK